MVGGIILGVAGVGAIALGCQGFTSKGIPWSKTKNITGNNAKIIGVACLLFGIPVSLIALFVMAFQAMR
jgi:hypothetical protein